MAGEKLVNGHYSPVRVKAAERLKEGDRVREEVQYVYGDLRPYARVGVVQGINYDYAVRVLWEPDEVSDAPYYALAHAAERLEVIEATA